MIEKKEPEQAEASRAELVWTTVGLVILLFVLAADYAAQVGKL